MAMTTRSERTSWWLVAKPGSSTDMNLSAFSAAERPKIAFFALAAIPVIPAIPVSNKFLGWDNRRGSFVGERFRLLSVGEVFSFGGEDM